MTVCTGLAQVCIWSGNTPTLNTEAFSAWQLSQMKNWFPPGCSYGQAPYPVVPTQNELNGIFDSLSHSIVSGLVCLLVSFFVCLFTLPVFWVYIVASDFVQDSRVCKCMCLYICMCFSCISFLAFSSVLSYSDLFFFSYSSLDACLFSNNRQKRCGSG